MGDPAPIQPGTSRELLVPPELAGERLDAVLARLLPEVSRSRWKTSIQAGQVRVGGRTTQRPNRLVERGERIEASLPAPAPSTDPEGRPIHDVTWLYEDEAIAVVDKPAGLVVHANERHPAGNTLAEIARARLGELPTIQGEHRPGIVHRLDRLTSGVMVLGRTTQALEELKRQFKEREVEKRYVALVHGAPRFASDWIHARIAPDPRNPRRMRVLASEPVEPERDEDLDEPAPAEGREASTYYEVLERLGDATLLECRPRTGRTHQIRVHLQSVGLPIVGDRIYRHPGALPRPLPEEAPRPVRQALHARRLAFRHPLSGDPVRFEAPLPEDIERLLHWLRNHIRRDDE